MIVLYVKIVIFVKVVQIVNIVMDVQIFKINHIVYLINNSKKKITLF